MSYPSRDRRGRVRVVSMSEVPKETSYGGSGPTCPFCKKVCEHDDGDPACDWQCHHCDKSFRVEVDYDITYYSSGLPCLNGEDHSYKEASDPKYWADQEATPYNCKWCRHTKWVKNERADDNNGDQGQRPQL